MATCGICASFDIIVEGDISGGGQTFTAPSAFTVIGITAINIAGGATTLTVSNAGTALTGTTAAPPLPGAGVVQAQAVAGPMSLVCVIAANANVAKGAAVLLVGGTAVTKVVLHCVRNPVTGTSPPGSPITIA